VTFWRIVGIAFVVKLVLTSAISIAPVFAPHDSSNFLEHAKFIAAGQWLGPYDAFTLIKGPFFPLYLAFVREFGVPLPLAHLVTYALACVLACIAIRSIVRDPRILGAMFAVLFFNPFTFEQGAGFTNRSQISGTLALAVIACATALFVRRAEPARASWIWSIGLGAFLSAFWLTREESVWLLPALAVLLVPFVLRARRETWDFAIERAAFATLPFALLLSSLAIVTQVNAGAYGWATVVELQSPEFAAAYGSLARIDHPPAERQVPVPHAALDVAYAVSPAALELRASLDGQNGMGWRSLSCNVSRICNEIAGGWFMWAFRQATEAAGHYRSGAEARAYYVRLAREINTACDAKRIACGPRRDTLVPPVTLADARPIARAFVDLALRIGALYDDSNFAQENFPENGPLARDYQFVTDSPYISTGRRDITGWLIAPDAASIGAYSGTTPDSSADLSFVPSPDLAPAMVRDGRGTAGAAHGRFDLSTACNVECSLRVTDSADSVTSIPLDIAAPDFANAHLIYHLESIDGSTSGGVAASDGLKNGILEAILGAYQHVVSWLLLASIALLGIELIGGLRRVPAEVEDKVVIGLALFLGTAAYVAILAAVETLSFPSTNPEYESVVYPIALFLGAFMFAARLPDYAARPTDPAG
jgi:hypothetical protein